jgi:hypothetical protein
MKHLCVILPALLLLGVAGGRPDSEEKEEIRKSIRFPEGSAARQIIVDNINGSIDVVGYDGAEIQLVAHRVSYGNSPEKVQQARTKITLDIKEEPGKVILYVNAPWRYEDGSSSYRGREDYGFDADFDFELKVPFKTDFFLKTVNKGTISVKNMQGAFEVSNVNGEIAMSGIAGDGLVSTVNGGVEVDFTRNPGSRCGFKTVNGSIEVGFPAGLSADLNLKTFNGEVYTDFDVSGVPHRPLEPEKTGHRTLYRGNEFFTVRAGNGGPEMFFETLNGDIRILKAH